MSIIQQQKIILGHILFIACKSFNIVKIQYLINLIFI